MAGDGTTTATLLAQAMIREVLRTLLPGQTLWILKRYPEDGEKAVEALKEQSKTIDKKKSIAQVATVSASDEEIGSLIADAMEKGGQGQRYNVEEFQDNGHNLEVVEGMQFDRGYISAWLPTPTRWKRY